jgi:uncharacterized protein (DUF342 family)
MPTTDCASAANIEISTDRLTVTLKAEAGQQNGITPSELLAKLRELGVALPETNQIEELAGQDGLIRPYRDIVLFEATPPEPQQRAQLDLLVYAPDPGTCSSYYERMAYLTAQIGQVIAKIRPEIPGKDGIDVLGNPIPYPRTPSVAFRFGKNVALDSDGLTVRATALGRICREAENLWVETIAQIPGDVDFSCGNIDVAGDVHIRGSVLDLFLVKGDNIFVNGAIEGAEICAIHDLHVGGGIVGKDKGRCTAGGDITCKYVSNATLVAHGNVASHGEIAHARIICGGRLTVERGPLASGHVTANGGVACRSLGSHLGAKVLVEAGFDDNLRSNARANLMEILAQKKLAAANKPDNTADDKINQLRQQHRASREKCVAEVQVQEILQAGVTVRFPGVEATTDSAWKGPLRLVPRQHDGEWEIVLIDTASNSTQVLPSRAWHDTAFEALQKVLAE